MAIKENTEASIRDKSITKIEGQPPDRTITKIIKELQKIASSIPTELGGGNHGKLL